ncbi:hypothetical protein L8106_03679 [Lyngbya sp. PCC 8106]|nr:hypothetical protein L8106_03679 [Lyngbya sp. PCC 8106]
MNLFYLKPGDRSPSRIGKKNNQKCKKSVSVFILRSYNSIVQQKAISNPIISDRLVLTNFSIKLAVNNSDQLNLCEVDRYDKKSPLPPKKG